MLFRPLDFASGEGFERAVTMFESYARTKGLELYGPLIIRAEPQIVGMRTEIRSYLMGQVRSAPRATEAPYDFSQYVRAENCLMARYYGPEDSLPVAYSKLQVYAFENGLRLSDTVYTVYVDDGEDDSVMVDVFVEVQE